MRVRSDYESAALSLRYLDPSINPLPQAKCPQADELDFPPPLRLNDLPRETYFPKNSGPMTHGELPKAVEFQRESIRPQIVEQRGL